MMGICRPVISLTTTGIGHSICPSYLRLCGRHHLACHGSEEAGRPGELLEVGKAWDEARKRDVCLGQGIHGAENH